MTMPRRRLYREAFHIDTNRINAKQGLPNMNMLEEWHNNDVILMEMSEPSMKEAFAGNNGQRVGKASKYGYSITYADTEQERDQISAIASILFPEGVDNSNKANDVEIVFNAAKYGRILITNDGGSKSQPGGILGNAAELKNKIGVTVVNDEQAVEIVKKGIAERDKRARYIAKNRKVKLPDWVGKD